MISSYTLIFFRLKIFLWQHVLNEHCVKSVCIRSFSDPYFPAFELNTETRSISLYSVRMRENTDQKN